MKTRKNVGMVLMIGGGGAGFVGMMQFMKTSMADDVEGFGLMLGGMGAAELGWLLYRGYKDYVSRDPWSAQLFIGPTGAALAYKF